MSTEKSLIKAQEKPLHLVNVSSRTSIWNSMVKLINEHQEEQVRDRAKILLSQYNTAGGIIIKNELELMLQEHGY